MAQWVKVAQVGEIPEGQVKVAEIQGRRLVLACLGSGYYAIDDRCTHDDGPLGEGELVGDLVECPRHGARFNVKTGQAVTLPAVVPVKNFPVKVVDNQVLVEIEEEEKKR